MAGLDLDAIFKLGSLIAALAVGWGVLKTQSNQAAKRLDSYENKLDNVIVPTLQQVQNGLTANTRLAEEALRQAQASHSRLDAHTGTIQALEVQQARLEERLDLGALRRTARVHPMGGEE